MPARCSCGCSQAPAARCRLRKVVCSECGYVLRVTREWIGHGMPVCACSGAFEPCCALDQAMLPTAEGLETARLIGALAAEFEVRSENARKAIRRRRRCKLETCGALVGKGELYCRSHVAEGMPF